MKKITIVDYGCGNLLSIKRGLEKIGFNSNISDNKKTILDSTHLILPGVGAFENAMNLLNKKDLVNTIKTSAIEKKTPLLGICLGMQLLLTKSYEFGEHNGLNLIAGEVKHIKSISNKNIKVPNIGWNEIKIKKDCELIKEFNDKSFYFIHSFVSITNENINTVSYCNYFNLSIPSIIKKDKIIGCQFHPEKSGVNGLKFLANFCNLI
jgi:imidazole glycerol-phosphate synthase subunit HisH